MNLSGFFTAGRLLPSRAICAQKANEAYLDSISVGSAWVVNGRKNHSGPSCL